MVMLPSGGRGAVAGPVGAPSPPWLLRGALAPVTSPGAAVAATFRSAHRFPTGTGPGHRPGCAPGATRRLARDGGVTTYEGGRRDTARGSTRTRAHSINIRGTRNRGGARAAPDRRAGPAAVDGTGDGQHHRGRHLQSSVRHRLLRPDQSGGHGP